MPYQTIAVRKLNPIIGAEIVGVDLSKDVGHQQFREIHDGLMENLVTKRMTVWIPIHSAPFNRDLELCAVDGRSVQTFDRRYRRIENGWKSVDTNEVLKLRPTHWRNW